MKLNKIKINKRDFNIDHSIIIGDNGGFYLLINSVNIEEKKFLEEIYD